MLAVSRTSPGWTQPAKYLRYNDLQEDNAMKAVWKIRKVVGGED